MKFTCVLVLAMCLIATVLIVSETVEAAYIGSQYSHACKDPNPKEVGEEVVTDISGVQVSSSSTASIRYVWWGTQSIIGYDDYNTWIDMSYPINQARVEFRTYPEMVWNTVELDQEYTDGWGHTGATMPISGTMFGYIDLDEGGSNYGWVNPGEYIEWRFKFTMSPTNPQHPAQYGDRPGNGFSAEFKATDGTEASYGHRIIAYCGHFGFSTAYSTGSAWNFGSVNPGNQASSTNELTITADAGNEWGARYITFDFAPLVSGTSVVPFGNCWVEWAGGIYAKGGAPHDRDGQEWSLASIDLDFFGLPHLGPGQSMTFFITHVYVPETADPGSYTGVWELTLKANPSFDDIGRATSLEIIDADVGDRLGDFTDGWFDGLGDFDSMFQDDDPDGMVVLGIFAMASVILVVFTILFFKRKKGWKI